MKIKYFLSSFILLSVAKGFAQSPQIEFEAPETYPEGITYNKAADVFYVSSARLGTIGKVDRQGKYSVLYADTSLKSTYGMKIAPGQNKLWVCVGDANYSKYTSPATRRKMIRLLCIDLQTGQKSLEVNLSDLIPGNHFANDLVFDNKGTAYITDSFSPVIYQVDATGKATIFAQNDKFKAAGVGLNGIVFHPGGFLLVGNGGAGSILKVDIKNPQQVSKVMIDKFFPGADGLLLMDNNNLVLVQNQGTNKVFKLTTTDNWATAKVTGATDGLDYFANPSTATMRDNEVWVMNAKFNELVDSNTVPSKKFTIKQAMFKPVK